MTWFPKCFYSVLHILYVFLKLIILNLRYSDLEESLFFKIVISELKHRWGVHPP